MNCLVAEMKDERHNPNFIADAAGSLMSGKFGGKIRLRAGETFITNGSIVVHLRAFSGSVAGNAFQLQSAFRRSPAYP